MNLFKEHQALIARQQLDYESLLPLTYNFKFRNINFDCAVVKNSNDGNILMNLTANLGILPYSSENIMRRTELLTGLARYIARGHVTIDHHCSISMSLTTIIKRHFDTNSLIEAIVYTILDARQTISHVSKYVEDPMTSPDQMKSP